MKKTLFITFLILSNLYVQAQKSSISGTIKLLPDTLVYLTRIGPNGNYKNIDSTYSNGEKFYFSYPHDSVGQTLYAIRVKNKFSPLGLFFLEKGNLHMEGVYYSSSFAQGAPINDSYGRYMQALKVLQEEQGRLYYNINQDSTQPADKKLDLKSKLTGITNAIQALHNAFIQEHRNDWLGTKIFKEQYPRSTAQEIRYRLNLFEPKFAEADPEIQRIAKQLNMLEKMDIGQTVSDFELPDQNGQIVKLSKLRGKYILLDFWASWCAPCRAENPNVIKAYNQYKSQAFEVVGISMDKNISAWEKAMQHDELPYINVIDQKGKYAEQYSIRSIPQSYLIDPEGKIVAKDLRGATLHSTLEKLLGK